MYKPQNILINNYDYNLPLDKIANHPLSERDKSKLLVYNKSNISESVFENISNYLNPEDLLVFNNTKVINARILFRKPTGAVIEVFCLEPYYPSDFYSSFTQKGKCVWKCFIGNLRKCKDNTLIKQYTYNSKEYLFKAKYIDNKNLYQLVEFSWDTDICFEEIIKLVGIIPLPFYIKRKVESDDELRYQTVYSKLSGSVASPTAGLHFTDKVISDINSKNISKTELTLHVGAGTFKPVSTNDVSKHQMHAEHVIISKDVIKLLINNINHIVAVGTTSLRALESIYWLGVKLLINENPNNLIISQWESYNLPQDIDIKDSLERILSLLEDSNSNNIQLKTEILIVPSYKFRVVNKLITNFHQPKSTLLLLVAAFIGNNWHNVYDYALNNNFRFLSYGDSSILSP